jgi:hypothetical protein
LRRARPFPAASRLVLAIAFALGSAPVRAQPAAPAPARPTEDEIKAVFLPKFARYVAWPAAARPAAGLPFQLCVIGRDPFGRILDEAAASEGIDGHGVIVRRLASAVGAERCHLAFVQGNAEIETQRLLDALRSLPILTVTDARAGPRRGMIHFTIISGHVRFFIDQASAAERGLSISSRLLALAAGVRQRRR